MKDAPPQADAEAVPDWPAVARVYAAVLERYFVDRNRNPDDAATRATIEINSTLVPKRGDNAIAWLGDMGGVESIQGLSILELGCGFGALASYLVVRGASSVVAIDIN